MALGFPDGDLGPDSITIEAFGRLVDMTPSLRVKLGVLSQMGALWVKSAGTKYSSNIRHRAVAVLLEDEVRRHKACVPHPPPLA